MKKLFILVGSLLVAGIAGAQVPTFGAQTLPLPPTIEGATTTNVALIMDVRKQASVDLQVKFKLLASSSNQLQTLTFAYSVDGVTYDTVRSPTITITPNSTTVVCLTTNLPTYGCGYIKLASWANGDGCMITNVAACYGVKISCP